MWRPLFNGLRLVLFTSLRILLVKKLLDRSGDRWPRVHERTPLAITAMMLRSMKLFAELGLVILGDIQPFLQLVSTMRKCALKATTVFNISPIRRGLNCAYFISILTEASIHFPIPAHFCFAHCLELFALARMLYLLNLVLVEERWLGLLSFVEEVIACHMVMKIEIRINIGAIVNYGIVMSER